MHGIAYLFSDFLRIGFRAEISVSRLVYRLVARGSEIFAAVAGTVGTRAAAVGSAKTYQFVWQ